MIDYIYDYIKNISLFFKKIVKKYVISISIWFIVYIRWYKMRKLLIVMMCFMLIGCGAKQREVSKEISSLSLHEEWIGKYKRNDGVVIEFLRDETNKDNMISFTIELGVKGFGDYAFIYDHQNQAIYDIEEDGHTLEFTLQHHRLIVKESGGISYLNTDLSGEYIKQ